MKKTVFAKRIRARMRDLRLSIKATADGAGIPRSTLGEWLNGRQPIFNDQVIRLAKFLKLKVEALASEEADGEGDEVVEADQLESVIKFTEDGFLAFHEGIYRVRLERFIDPKKGKKK